MPFDLATAKPAESGGFDLASAKAGTLTGADQIPGNQPVGPTPPSDSWGDMFKGVGETARTMLTGIAAPVKAAVQSLPGTGVRPPGGFMDRMGADVYTPQTQTGQNLVAGVGRAADQMQALGPEFGGYGSLMRGAGEAASLSNVRAPLGAATQRMGDMARDVPNIPGRVGEAVGRMGSVSPEIADLAQKAQAAGIPLRPDMLGNSKIMRMIGDTLENVPLTGGMGAKRQTAFNQAIISTIGGDANATKLTPDIYKKAMQTSGQAIGELSSKYDIPMNGGLSERLASLKQGTEFETDSTARILNRYIDEISRSSTANGMIDGTNFRKIRTQLTGQMRRSTEGDLKYALSNLDDVMLDSVKAQLTADELASYDSFRRQYSYGKLLEPMVAKGTGDIGASQLMGRMTSTSAGKSGMAKGTAGELGDLARIGQQFLGEPSVPKNVAFGVGGVGGLGALAPGTTASVLGTVNAYNRAAPSIARGMIEKSKFKPPGTP